MPVALEVRNICKTYLEDAETEIHANDNISFALHQGEIHALLGENGAGKTTLVKILGGLIKPDSGQIRLYDQLASFKNPKEALDHKIGIAHQDLSQALVERHTVAENILYLAKGALLSTRMQEALVREALEKYQLGKLDPHVKVWKLSGGEKQRVEILKSLISNPDIIILDEPTSMLTPPEVEDLFKLLRGLKNEGKAIIIITHILEEAIQLSDRITVLRQGAVVASLDKKDVKNLRKDLTQGSKTLARLMVGREVLYHLDRKPMKPGNTILEVKELCVKNDMGIQAVKNVSFSVKEKAILGIAGITGNGQRELVEGILNLRKIESGKVLIHDVNVTRKTIKQIRNLGVSYLPENRFKALVLDLSVRENLILNRYEKKSKKPRPHTLKDIPHFFTNGWKKQFIDQTFIANKTDELIEKFRIETPSASTPLQYLSGGNKQKTVVARELSQEPPVDAQLLLIIENPTSGLDVATTQFVRQQLLNMREAGSAILLVSSDLTEILALCDEIAVMFKGEIVGTSKAKDATRERLGLMMGGVVR
ncbi:MAG: ABC transporter ATP-binding protein [Candidatus Hodarchaeota archaeon]